MKPDPTYDREKIRENPYWQLAFILSEIFNENAPVGWHGYMSAAGCLLDYYDMGRKTGKPPSKVRKLKSNYCPACGMLRSQCDCWDTVNQPKS